MGKMSEELKTCPFCGGRAKVYKGHSLYADKIPTCIFCTKCGAQTLLCRLEQAPKLWNTRTETPTQKRIEELEAENRRLRKTLEEIEDFAQNEYWKTIPAPICVKFRTIKQYAEKALKGAGE